MDASGYTHAHECPWQVIRVEMVQARGLYHLFVQGGSYYVDGILASDYYGVVPKAALKHQRPAMT